MQLVTSTDTMKQIQSALIAVKLLVVLYWIFCNLVIVKGYNKLEAFYITPVQRSHQDISPCSQFLNHYHNDSFNCSVLTLNQILINDYRYMYKEYSPLNHRLVVFLSGIHVANTKQVKTWFSGSKVFNETIIGLKDVKVTCVQVKLILHL